MGLKSPAKTPIILMEFNPVDIDPVYITNFTQDVTYGPFTYESVHESEIDLPPNTGTMDEKSRFKVSLPRRHPFAAAISKEEPYPRTTIKVTELARSEGDVGYDEIAWFNGWVSTAIRNPNQRSGIVSIECTNVKSKAAYSKPGLFGWHYCNWMFGKGPCANAVDLDALREAAILTVVSGKVIQVTGLDTTGIDRYFHRGFVRRKGVRIEIHEYIIGSTFLLRRDPPEEWLGNSISVYPGCWKTIEACREPHRNAEEWFNAPGYGTPSRNPILEE